MYSTEIVKGRIKYLQELYGLTPEKKVFGVLARLQEAKVILELLESKQTKNKQEGKK